MSTTLIPWKNRLPGLFDDFEREMSTLMSRFGNLGGGAELRSEFGPMANIAESDTEYEVTVDLPGLTPDEINVEFKHGDLWITGERKQESEEEGKRYHRVERRYGQFQRVLPLGDDVDAEHVDAQYKDGVLRLVIPKTETSQTKRITVKG